MLLKELIDFVCLSKPEFYHNKIKPDTSLGVIKDFSDIKKPRYFIDDTQNINLNKLKVTVGDLLVNFNSKDLIETTIVPEYYKELLPSIIAYPSYKVIIKNPNKVTLDFINYLLNTDEILSQLDNYVTLNRLKNLDIILPDLSKQGDFITISNNIKELELKIKNLYNHFDVIKTRNNTLSKKFTFNNVVDSSLKSSILMSKSFPVDIKYFSDDITDLSNYIQIYSEDNSLYSNKYLFHALQSREAILLYSDIYSYNFNFTRYLNLDNLKSLDISFPSLNKQIKLSDTIEFHYDKLNQLILEKNNFFEIEYNDNKFQHNDDLVFLLNKDGSYHFSSDIDNYILLGDIISIYSGIATKNINDGEDDYFAISPGIFNKNTNFREYKSCQLPYERVVLSDGDIVLNKSSCIFKRYFDLPGKTFMITGLSKIVLDRPDIISKSDLFNFLSSDLFYNYILEYFNTSGWSQLHHDFLTNIKLVIQ